MNGSDIRWKNNHRYVKIHKEGLSLKRMRERKEKCMGKKKTGIVKKAVAAVGGFALSQVAGGLITAFAYKKKVEQQQNHNNQMCSVVLSKGEVYVKEEIENAYVSSWSSKVNITIAKPTHERMTLELYAVFSNVNIFYPDDVKVIMDGQEYVHRKESSDTETLPEIYIIKNAAGSKINMEIQQ